MRYVSWLVRILSRMSTPKIAITDQDQTRGSADAKVQLIEYGDYQCPSCGQAAPIVDRVVKHFGDKLLFAFRNFPLEQHEFAEPAAETAEFAAEKGKFWEMHDLLYKHQREFSEELFPKLAEKLDLDGDELTEVLEAGKYSAKVEKDYATGEKAGVPGTPAFFINGKLWDGSFAYDDLIQAIKAAE